MSQQTKPGRRTPLSLGPAKNDGSDKAQMRTTKVNLEKLSTELLAKNVKNGSPDEKTENNKTENGQSSANGSTTKKDGNGVHSDIPIENSKTSDASKQATDKGKQNDKVKDDKIAAPKVGEKPAEKAKTSNEKVASTNENQKSPNDAAIGISKIEEKVEKVDSKNGEKEVRESIRQKQIREEKEKEENDKDVPNSQPTKATPSTPDKTSESSKLKEKRKPEVVPTPAKTPKAAPSESLLAEKSLKGFNENLQEESMKATDSPMPAKEVKILKLSQGAPPSASRHKRSEKLDDASLVVNLSTVSELSVESNSNSTPAVERNYSLRHITGRRSTRPLREMSFDFRMRESYYKSHPELCDSISTANVTSSSESPRVGGQSKRTFDDEETGSSKRSRFEFGLLDFVTSPVKKLGAKFSRSTLSTSTPNKIPAEDIPSGIEAEHFVSDDLATIELNTVDEVAEKKMEIDTEIPAEEVEPIEVNEPSKSRCVLM